MLDRPNAKIKPVPHPEFARRMQIACDNNPDVPLPNYGRLGWFVTEIERRFNVTVTVETVRKWFAGDTFPRPKMMGYLAAVLSVDHAWLSVGATPEISEKQKKVRNATADGAVNLIAGLIQICGGHPAFPAEDDSHAKSKKIDLYAFIKGAQYAFHVSMGNLSNDGVALSVPIDAVGAAVVLAVVRTGELAFRFFEVDAEKIEAQGKRKGEAYHIVMPAEPGDDWKEIRTFSERL